MLRLAKVVYALLPRHERRQAAVVLALMFVTALLELTGVGAVLPFLSIATDPDIIQRNETLNWLYSTLGFETETAFVVFAAGVMLAVVVVTNVVSAVALWAQTRFVYRLGHSLAVRLLTRYLARPYAYFLTHNTSGLGKNVLSDTNTVVTGVLRPGIGLLSRAIVIAAVVGLIVVLEPVVTLSMIAILGGTYGIVYLVVQRRLLYLGRHSVKANHLRYKTSAEVFGGIKEIMTLGREAYFLGQYGQASSRYATIQTKRQLYSQWPRFFIQTVAFGGLILSFIVLALSGRDMTQAVPLMGFLAFAALRLMPALQQILAALSELRFHQHLLLKLHADLMAPDGAPVPPSSSGAATSSGLAFTRELRLEQVRFRYPGADKDVIRALCLNVPKNTSVALVGATGAGKTTLVDIILGLLVPSEGVVTVDGIPVTAENATAWRRHVGYVPQDVYLTDDTITKNIAYGIDDAAIDGAAVERAATIAHIHDFIVTELPHGYETTIGERGVRLSGGQRQRLGIARALYHDPELLVLDEATSDIDNLTEAYITEAIHELAGKKTLVIVAHRLATIQRCDCVCLLDQGEIAASGTYEDLVATSTGFQQLAHPTNVGATK